MILAPHALCWTDQCFAGNGAADVKAVLDNCDLIYVLSRGRIIAAGDATEIAAHPEVRAVYLGEDYQPREEVRADA